MNIEIRDRDALPDGAGNPVLQAMAAGPDRASPGSRIDQDGIIWERRAVEASPRTRLRRPMASLWQRMYTAAELSAGREWAVTFGLRHGHGFGISSITPRRYQLLSVLAQPTVGRLRGTALWPDRRLLRR